MFRKLKNVCILAFGIGNNYTNHCQRHTIKHMQSRIIIILLFSVISVIGFGQADQHHRTYESSLNDTIFNHMESTTTTGEVISIGFRQFENDKQTIVLATLDAKGNIKWQREIDFGRDTTTLVGLAKIDLNSTKDSILFSCIVNIDGENKELFGRCSKDGNNCTIRSIEGGESSKDYPNVASFIDSTEILLTSGDRPTIARIGHGEDILWSRKYNFNDGGGTPVQSQITDIVGTIDSTILLADDASEGNFLLAELDSNGVQVWAENYTLQVPDMVDPYPRQVIKLDNMSSAVVGNYGTSSSDENGFVMVVDTFGAPIFARQVLVDGNPTDIKNVLQTEDGSIWMSGIYMVNDSSFYFTTNMSVSGVINWTTIYPGILVGDETVTPSFSSLRPVEIGGAFLAGHAIDEAGLTMLNVMKHNEMGETPCSDTISVSFIDINVTTDTLFSEETIENGGIFFNTFEVEVTGTNILSPPTLNIVDAYQFCPNEPIDTVLIAVVSGVSEITYQWGDENGVLPAFDDSLRIVKEGQYSVTVTIAEDVCYQMCDTIEVTRTNLPMPAIGFLDLTECSNGAINFENLLNVTVDQGQSPFEYIWSTNETADLISVNTEGTYSVTVTDQCGDTGTATIQTVAPIYNPQISIEQIDDTFCISNAVVLSAFYTGGGNGAVFEWKDNSGNIIDPFLSANFASQILATSEEEYTVSVIDECGNTATNSIDVNFPDREEVCVNDFSFPKVFFPRGTEDTEMTFGPIPRTVQDPMESDTINVLNRISDIEFKVFNRWGEEVYSVDSQDNSAFLMPWNGTHKGDPAPSEVYIYYFSYILDKDINPEAPTLIKKGDVTLVR
jgi:hypothetical protein